MRAYVKYYSKEKWRDAPGVSSSIERFTCGKLLQGDQNMGGVGRI